MLDLIVRKMRLTSTFDVSAPYVRSECVGVIALLILIHKPLLFGRASITKSLYIASSQNIKRDLTRFVIAQYLFFKWLGDISNHVAESPSTSTVYGSEPTHGRGWILEQE